MCIRDSRATLPPAIARPRTFSSISHPAAGNTTLTEKLLLFGGAIQMAGQVRAKGEARRTRSVFMKMEQERGISVSASAMSFDFRHYRFNLVDTPGHSDFSEAVSYTHLDVYKRQGISRRHLYA